MAEKINTATELPAEAAGNGSTTVTLPYLTNAQIIVQLP